MANLVSIEGKTRPAVMKGDIVECLERWLEMARNGEITSLAMVAIHAGGDSLLCSPPTEQFHALLGATTMLQHDMMHAMMDDGD